MPSFSLKYKPFGESAILIEWPSRMNNSILEDMLAFQKSIKENSQNRGFEMVQSVHSLTLIFPDSFHEFGTLKLWLEKCYSMRQTENKTNGTLWNIPVCYDECFGLDLAEIAYRNSISKQQIIEIHSKQVYQVYSIGFLPGFPYLGGLDKRLYIDRKAKPRLKTPKGSVGIGGKQTGIYPIESPGGWQIIGNTPIHLFDAEKPQPSHIQAGDKIKFVPISLSEHEQLSKLVSNKTYQIRKEVFVG